MTKSSRLRIGIRYSEERKREWKMGWKVRSEKDMNKRSMRWSVVVSVMTI